MTLQFGALRAALISAGCSPEKADAAAEEVAKLFTQRASVPILPPAPIPLPAPIPYTSAPIRRILPDFPVPLFVLYSVSLVMLGVVYGKWLFG